MTPTSIVAYVVLFAVGGFLFLFASLLIGRLLRPRLPTPEKLETYECGEPTIGSSRVQFDLRFYVVALVFLVFDVEVAFFFPWATVFGKANALSNPHVAQVEQPDGATGPPRFSPATVATYRQLGVADPALPAEGEDASENTRLVRETGRRLALASMADMAVFFAVLLVGFAYVWRRGDLEWVRSFPQRNEKVFRPCLVRGAPEPKNP